jgi:hypothetical protein
MCREKRRIAFPKLEIAEKSEHRQARSEFTPDLLNLSVE